MSAGLCVDWYGERGLGRERACFWDCDAARFRLTILRFLGYPFCSIGKGTGYKPSELVNMQDGSTLIIGGKEIEVFAPLRY